MVLCLTMIWPAAAAAQEKKPSGWTGNANLFIGARFLEEDNWEPVEQPMEAGVLLDFRPRKWWVSLAFDFLYAWEQGDIDMVDLGVGSYTAEVEVRIIEFDVGIRKIWESPRYLRPFIGAGLAVVNGRVESEARGGSAADEDTGFGLWVGAGTYLTFSNRFNIGIEGRWSKAEVDLFDTQARVGGWHIGVIAGLHW